MANMSRGHGSKEHCQRVQERQFTAEAAAFRKRYTLVHKVRPSMNLFGGIEAGGTKFVCGIWTGPDNLDVTSFPTNSPQESVRQAVEFFQGKAPGLTALGVASFGPLDLDRTSPTYGYITRTPKTAWRNFDIVGSLKALSVPVAFETDVNAAAVAEARWGAARDVEDCAYLTVGTGIGVVCSYKDGPFTVYCTRTGPRTTKWRAKCMDSIPLLDSRAHLENVWTLRRRK
jgi:hypothetical protein